MDNKSPGAFRTISEVSTELDVPKHVLRFWESKFTQIKPMKLGGGRRYYRPEDLDLLRGIRGLLYDRGYTIKGVQKIFKENGVRYVKDFSKAPPPAVKAPVIPDLAADVQAKRQGGKAARPVAVETPALHASHRKALLAALKDLMGCREALAAVH